jgi:transcriptional regulator with XRE-family HTH domain
MKNDGKISLGGRLKQIRKAARLNQDEFASGLGVHLRTYSYYEHDEREPDASFLKAVCEKYDIEPAWLLLGEGPMRRSESSDEVKQPTPQPAPQAEGEPFDWEVHKMVIVELQRYLDLRKGRLEPDDYAEAVKLLYEIAIEDVEKSEGHQPDRRKVAKIIEFSRLVA